MQTSYPTIYQDFQGIFKTEIINNTQIISVKIRDVLFEGPSPDSLSPVENTSASLLRNFEFFDKDLCNYSLLYKTPVKVLDIYSQKVQEADLEIKLIVGKPTADHKRIDKINLQLILYLHENVYRSKGSSGWFEDELLEIQQLLPGSFKLMCCFGCMFSDYHPVGHGSFGNMLCFKNHKEDYLEVKDKEDLLKLWNESDQTMVQETFLCDEYEVREEDIGYRG